MTRMTAALAFSICALGLAGPASAQDADASPRSQMIDEVRAECSDLATRGDAQVADCEAALADMRRSTSPVVVARIRDQYRSSRDERMAEAASAEFDLFDERDDYEWEAYGDERAD